MRILVVFTGGTIGSTLNESGYFATDSEKKYKLLDLYKSEYNDTDVIFEVVEPYSILSEQLNWEVASRLIETVKGRIDMDYDGIIITHGSDTLQYTASVLSYAFGNSCKPIILVCSNYVLEDERANGLSNFKAAVDTIRRQNLKGVLVTYQNRDRIYIHRGSRMQMHNAYSDEVYSIINSEIGYWLDNEYTPNPDYSESVDEMYPLEGKSDIKNPSFDRMKEGMAKPLQKQQGNQLPKILWLHSYPEFPWNMVDIEAMDAILITAYHSGTINTENPEFASFMKKARNNGIRVFLVGAVKEAVYESKIHFDELGICTLPVMSPVAAYVKMFMLSLYEELNEENMRSSLGGDIITK